MKRTVLFVVDERQMGGVSIVLEDILSLMDISKYEIDVLVLHNRGNKLVNLASSITLLYGTPYFEAIDYTIKEILKSGNIKLIAKKVRLVFDLKSGRILKRIRKERKHILKKKYDVEIAFKDGFTAIFTAAGNSKKKIHWLHYEYKEKNPNAKYDTLFQKILPMFDEIIGVSKTVLKSFNEIYNLENRSFCIPNVIDDKRILKRSEEPSTLILHKTKINMVSIGRLHEIKGYKRLIITIAELRNCIDLNTISLDIYGDGPQKEELRQCIKEYKLTGVVQLKGEVDNPYNILKKYDFSISASYYEAFGLNIVESMILKVPVLALKTANTGQLIDDRKNGWIYENSKEGLLKGLLDILGDKNKIIEAKVNLEGYQYNNEEILKKLEEVINT